MPKTDSDNGCGGKHLRLMLAVIGVFLVVFVGAVWAFNARTAAAVEPLESRVRTVEIRAERADANTEFIRSAVERMERKIDRIAP